MGKPDIGDNERHLCPLMIVGNTSMVNLMEKKNKKFRKSTSEKKIPFHFHKLSKFLHCVLCRKQV